MKLSKPLTWDELADIYDSCCSTRPARTQPMDKIFAWAEKQTDKFQVTANGSICSIVLT